MPCHLIEVAVLSSLLLPSFLSAQTAFDVASIKPTAVRDGSFTIDYPPGGRFSAKNVTVRTLLQSAYGVQDYQIQDGPAWLATAGFDIEARPAEGAGDLSFKQVFKQVQSMLQALLADRFHLTLHRETRQRPIYALIVGKNGPRLAVAGSLADPARMMMGQIVAQKMTLASLASILTFDLKRPVKDETGLTGEYAIKLEWVPGLGESDAAPVRPSLFTAVQDQLGLKLDSATGPVEVLVIDQLQRPDEN